MHSRLEQVGQLSSEEAAEHSAYELHSTEFRASVEKIRSAPDIHAVEESDRVRLRVGLRAGALPTVPRALRLSKLAEATTS
jgi:hypothetical protein